MYAGLGRLFYGCIEVMLTHHFKSIQFQQYPFGNGGYKLLSCRLLPNRCTRYAEEICAEIFRAGLPTTVNDCTDIALYSRCSCVITKCDFLINLFSEGGKRAVLNTIDNSIPQQAENIIAVRKRNDCSSHSYSPMFSVVLVYMTGTEKSRENSHNLLPTA